MSYVRTLDEVGLDWRRASDAEVDEYFAWADVPAELLAVEPADTLGIPDSQRVALALLVELSPDGFAIVDPLDAIAVRLGWTHPDDVEPLRWVSRERVRLWLGGPLRALCERGFVRLLGGGALLVTWRAT